MIDGYAHVDMSVADPVCDLDMHMKDAGVTGAFVIETWDKSNRSCIEQISAKHLPRFRSAVCFRNGEQKYVYGLLQLPNVLGMRIRTEDVNHAERFADYLEESGRWLVTHAESKIGILREQLLKIAKRHPGLRLYVPHFGWPRQNGQDDGDWHTAMRELSTLPNCVVGLSAIAAFSNESYPHPDVCQFAIQLYELFGAHRIIIGSDYPLLPMGMYSQYMALAKEWSRVPNEQASGDARPEAELFRNSCTSDSETSQGAEG